jgi:hypothetical protein
MASNAAHRMWSIAILSVCVIVFSITVLYVTSNQSGDSNSLTVALKSESESLKVGNPTTLNVYFSGLNAAQVLAADIRLKYDPALVKVTKVEPGPYYQQPYIVKSDLSKNIYALAANPAFSQSLNPMLSVVKFEITPLRATDALEFSLDAESKVYIEKKGEASLDIQPAKFTVQKP